MLKGNTGRFVAAFLSATLFCAAALAQVPQPTLPQPAQPQVTPTVPPGSHQLTPEDLDAFFDGLIPLQLQQDDIAGAVVLIVKDGNVLFARGYGFADADRKKPVSVDDTLFRPGSISKLFTWTAVMQLVEQGKLDLDRDINDYLDFKVPPAFGAPITLRNLMTHTPGFEEALKDLLAPDANHLMPLQTYLSTHMPNRIFPPGSVPAYSNYGTTLAGYIVQRVSGKPFEQYIQENIFAPLRMTHSTFAQPLPDALKPMMSAGFRLESEGAKPFELVQPVPAGALSSSAGDIARFMIAHLQNGRFEDKQILKPETAQLMHSRQFGLDPQMNGMALGFYEESGNGHRIIGHGGDTMYFHSDLHLIPDANLGFFVSYNSEGRNDISPRGPLWQQFLDRYYPVPSVEIPHVATAVQDARAASGSYISSRRSQTNVLKILSWFDVDQARPGPEGTVIVDSRKGLNGKPRRWYDTGSQLYQDRDGKRHIAFRADGAGRMQMLTDFPAAVMQRVPWYQSKKFNYALLGGVLLVLMATLLLWPIAALVRAHYSASLPLFGVTRFARTATRVVCLVDLLVIAAWLGFLIYGSEHLSAFSSDSDSFIRVVQMFAWIGIAGLVFVVLHGAHVWFTRQYRWWARITETLVVLACLGWVWLIVSWNLLHKNLMY